MVRPAGPEERHSWLRRWAQRFAAESLRKPFVTGSVLVANAAVYVHHHTLPSKLLRDAFLLKYCTSSDALARGEWWRLATSAFLHSGLPHILSNAVALYRIGPIAERTFGHLPFALLYAAAGVACALVSAACHRVHAVGASGAVLGLTGALLANAWWRGGSRQASGLEEDDPYFVWTMLQQAYLSVAYPLMKDGFTSNVDVAGHLGGLVCGAAFGWLFAAVSAARARRDDRRRAAAAADRIRSRAGAAAATRARASNPPAAGARR